MKPTEAVPEAKIFRHLRMAAGLTTRELAKLMECNSSFITHYESGRHPLPKSRAEQLSRIFNVTAEQLHEFKNGRGIPINYRDECYLLISKMDRNQLEAVYGMLVNMTR
jgi:transcriptional regulator with XRE-family HTH domain